MKCKRTSQTMKIEIDLIKKHLDKHKGYHHLSDDEIAITDFLNKYAWIMREAVCAFCDNHKCKLRKENIEPLPDISDADLSNIINSCESDGELTKIELRIIKKHINDHKWFNKIPTYSDAISDFLDKYAWVIKELKETRSKIS